MESEGSLLHSQVPTTNPLKLG